jgi:hypothetical protein
MSDDCPESCGDRETDLERELRRGRKFTPQEALARLAGPGAMKGASPVSPVQQAEMQIGTWLRSHVVDPDGALQVVLHRHLKGSELLLNSLADPLHALAGHCRQLLDSEYLLGDLVREVDLEWGRRMGERPHFERQGSSPHPDDPYTIDSVRRALADALRRLGTADQ